MHYLARHASKSAEDQLTKLCRFTSGAIREREKFDFKISYVSRKQFLCKTKEHYQTEKNSKNVYNLILGALFLYSTKSVKDQFVET